MKIVTLISVILFTSLCCASANAGNLEKVIERGFVQCGVHEGLLGFGIKSATGRWEGFDVEFCRALSTAIFSDPEKVEFIPLSASNRFDMLFGQKVDVIYRNTTWTHSRDTSLGLTFVGVNYYDGQGFMVKADKGINSAYELSGTRLCLIEGTSSNETSIDFFNDNYMNYKLVFYPTSNEAREGFEQDGCDVLSIDQSQLYALKLGLKDPGEAIILPELISKEPLGPVVRQGDEQWADIVRWTLNVMIEAEFLGVDSNNATSLRTSGYSEQKRLLGTEEEPNFVEFGLNPNWVYDVITKVGNYGEVFKRTIGAQSELQIARGLNAQWNNGGILYSQPLR